VTVETLNAINDFLWTYVIIAVLVGTAIYFTFKSGGIQIRYLHDACRIILGKDKNDHRTLYPGQKRIGSFEAFSVSLAGRVGTGNIAGVASALFVGGPGAIFWMWAMAFFGAATAFAESTLAQLYKKRGATSFYGGPAYYMRTGLGNKWMGAVFSVLMVFSFGMCQNIVQSNTISTAFSDTFHIHRVYVAIVVAFILFYLAIGGINRISKHISYLVPFMAAGYVLLAAFIIGKNITEVPAVFELIFKNAFGMEQVGGGMVGTAILQGVKRGLFSNEAGEGSSPNAAAIADTSHPVKQGLLQAIGVFVDTIVICSCTAFIILLSGQLGNDYDGIILTSRSLETQVGSVGKYFITAAIFLFAFSSIIANYYYGETNIRFLLSRKSLRVERIGVRSFRIISFFIVLSGAFLTLQEAWSLVDLSMGLLTIVNVTALFLLSKKVFALITDYRRQRKNGVKDPVFDKNKLFKNEVDKLEGW